MNPRTRRTRLLRIALFVAALAALVYILRDIDPAAVWHTLLRMNPWLLLPVAIGVLVMPLVRAMRLRLIMEPQQALAPMRVFSAYNIGQLLNVMLPALTGQVARVLFFSRTFPITKTFAFASVMLEVLFDGLVLVVMIFAASFLVVMPDWMVKGEVVVFIACLLLLGFFYRILHRHRNPNRRPSLLRKKLPAGVLRRWDNMKESFLAGLDMLTSRRHLTLVVLLSILSWVSHALIVMFLLQAFGFSVPFWGAIVILIVNTLAIMIPVSPGNLGVFQVASVVGLAFFHVPKDEALAFSIVLHVAELGPIFALGAVSSLTGHVRIREYTDADLLGEEERLKESLDDSRLQPTPQTAQDESVIAPGTEPQSGAP